MPVKIYKTFSKEAAKVLKNGGVGVIPTDTLYGIVASALDPKAVKKVYALRNRNPLKPAIIIISSFRELGKFGIAPTGFAKKFLKKYWPGKVSVILPFGNADKRGLDADLRGKNFPEKKFYYLHRETNALAFRLPADKKLIAFLKQTGPLIAPSANPEGKPPAKTVAEAKKYFGGKADSTGSPQVNFYVDAGCLTSRPSTLIKISGGKVVVLRQGTVKI